MSIKNIIHAVRNYKAKRYKACLLSVTVEQRELLRKGLIKDFTLFNCKEVAYEKLAKEFISMLEVGELKGVGYYDIFKRAYIVKVEFLTKR